MLVGCEVGLWLVVVLEKVGIPLLDEALPAEVVDVDVVGFLFGVSDFEAEELETELALVLVEPPLVGGSDRTLVPSDLDLAEVDTFAVFDETEAVAVVVGPIELPVKADCPGTPVGLAKVLGVAGVDNPREVVERLEMAILVPAADVEVKVLEASELVDTDGGGGATDVQAKPVAVGDDRRPLASAAEPLASPTEFDERLDLLSVLLGDRVVGLTLGVVVVGFVGERAVMVDEVVGVATLLVGGDTEKAVAEALVPEKVAPLEVVG